MNGVLISNEQGEAVAYALWNLEDRGPMIIEPGWKVYQGMIVGENPRNEDMDVNPTKEKKLTNVRSSTGDELERLIPAKNMSMEQALEFCAGDECLEVTPAMVRIRKVTLNANERAKERKGVKKN